MRDEQGRPLLAATVLNFNVENINVDEKHSALPTIKFLVARGADVNAKESDGTTALMEAARRRGVDLVRYLLSQGAEINARNHSGATALLFAANCGGSCADYSAPNEGVFLIASGASVNVRDKTGYTALMSLAEGTATDGPDLGFARFLLSHGADVNVHGPDGMTAWRLAKLRSLDDSIWRPMVRLLREK